MNPNGGYSWIPLCFLFTLTVLSQAAIQTNVPTRINPTYEALQAALVRGGLIQFNRSATILLSTNLNITKDAILDATDRSIIIFPFHSKQTWTIQTSTNLTIWEAYEGVYTNPPGFI